MTGVSKTEYCSSVGSGTGEMNHDEPCKKETGHLMHQRCLETVGQEPLEIFHCRPEASCSGGVPGAGMGAASSALFKKPTHPHVSSYGIR